MARKVSFSAMESRSARLNKFTIRRRPYSGPSLARGILLLYRRNKTNGTWVVKVSDGHGAYWTRGFALADDFEDANGTTVLTFHDAQGAAKKLARGDDGSSAIAEPVTVDGALAAYETDLTARNANVYNAKWPRLHLSKVLLNKPIAVTTSAEWKNWRDSLLDVMARSTINRLIACVRAALAEAARHDKRIQNREAWEVGLAGLPNAQRARNIVLSDDTVRAFISAAYEVDNKFGLLTETLAVTGTRPSQAARLNVEDLRDHPKHPTLWMPRAGKGGHRNRAEKKLEHFSVLITPELAAKLRAAARGRSAYAPLLLQSDGSSWVGNPGAGYYYIVRKIVKAIGADPNATMYSMRHSSVVRMLLKKVPTSVVAARHDTSEAMIRKYYARYISEYSDDVSRHALLQPESPVGENVVALAG
jgi:integrase